MKRATTQEQQAIKEKTQKKFPKNVKGKTEYDFNEVFKEAYKVFKDKQELEKLLEVKENKWDSYSAAAFGVKKMKDLTDAEKTSFEFYLCGWLQYYDQVTRNNGIDHTIHFKWRAGDVIVYIYPKPGQPKKNSIGDPPGNPTSDPQSPKAPPPPNP